jgi:hypothetical protein
VRSLLEDEAILEAKSTGIHAMRTCSFGISIAMMMTPEAAARGTASCTCQHFVMASHGVLKKEE